MVQSFLNSGYALEYGFSLLVLNIVVYLVLMSIIFCVFLMFNINLVQNLSGLRLLNSYKFFSILIILSFLSLAGIPPLLGFIGKFLLLITIIGANNYILFIFLSIINLFTLYFYLQNTRFIISKTSSVSSNVLGSKVTFSFTPITISCFANVFNFLGIFIFEDLLLQASTLFWI